MNQTSTTHRNSRPFHYHGYVAALAGKYARRLVRLNQMPGIYTGQTTGVLFERSQNCQMPSQRHMQAFVKNQGTRKHFYMLEVFTTLDRHATCHFTLYSRSLSIFYKCWTQQSRRVLITRSCLPPKWQMNLCKWYQSVSPQRYHLAAWQGHQISVDCEA